MYSHNDTLQLLKPLSDALNTYTHQLRATYNDSVSRLEAQRGPILHQLEELYLFNPEAHVLAGGAVAECVTNIRAVDGLEIQNEVLTNALSMLQETGPGIDPGLNALFSRIKRHCGAIGRGAAAIIAWNLSHATHNLAEERTMAATTNAMQEDLDIIIAAIGADPAIKGQILLELSDGLPQLTKAGEPA